MASVKNPRPTGRPRSERAAKARNRVEIRRRAASTTLRLQDRHIALLHKLADKKELPLSEALEFALDTACTHAGVKVRASKTADLGWV